MILKKKIIFSILIIGVIALLTIRYQCVNADKYITKTYSIGDTIHYNDCEYTLTEAKVKDVGKDKQLVIKMDVKNNTKKEQVASYMEFSFESGAFHQGSSIDAYYEDNNTDVDSYIESGGTENVVLRYDIGKDMLKKRYWKDWDNRKKMLVFCLQPEKIQVDLDS